MPNQSRKISYHVCTYICTNVKFSKVVDWIRRKRYMCGCVYASTMNSVIIV